MLFSRTVATIGKLTPELVRLFIQRIELGESTVKYSRSSVESAKIVYLGMLGT